MTSAAAPGSASGGPTGVTSELGHTDLRNAAVLVGWNRGIDLYRHHELPPAQLPTGDVEPAAGCHRKPEGCAFLDDVIDRNSWDGGPEPARPTESSLSTQIRLIT